MESVLSTFTVSVKKKKTYTYIKYSPILDGAQNDSGNLYMHIPFYSSNTYIKNKFPYFFTRHVNNFVRNSKHTCLIHTIRLILHRSSNIIQDLWLPNDLCGKTCRKKNTHVNYSEH